MAKDEETDGEEEEEEGGGGKKKIIMIVGVLAIAGAAYNFVLKPAPPVDEMAMEEVEEVEPEIVEGEILQLDEMILNLADAEGNRGFLRIGIAIVLEELIVAKDFEAESAIAKDVAVQYLSSKMQEDLATSEGREMAKEELSMLVREAYGDEKVSRVLFTALVMQ